MTEHELHDRLRAWYRAGAEEPSPALFAAIAAIPGGESIAEHRGSPFRAALVLAAVLVTVLLLGGAVALGSGLLRLPSVAPPDALPARYAAGQLDVCAAIPADALNGHFAGLTFSAGSWNQPAGGRTGDWRPEFLGNPVRSCWYDGEGVGAGIHVALEPTRAGEAHAVALAFLGSDLRELPMDGAWYHLRPNSGALVVHGTDASRRGYVGALTMELPAAERPNLVELARWLGSKLSAVLSVRASCDVMKAVFGNDPDDRYFEGHDSPQGWSVCAYGWDGGWGNPHLLLSSRILARERAAALLRSPETLIPDMPAVWAESDGRWTADGSDWHAVAVSCEPHLFIVTEATARAAGELASRAAAVVCG